MASTNKTANLGLSQWEQSDAFSREDLNEDFRKIDGAFRRQLSDVTVGTEATSLQLVLPEFELDDYSEIIVSIGTQTVNMWMAFNQNRNANFYTYLSDSSDATATTGKRMQVRFGTNRLAIAGRWIIHRSDAGMRVDYTYKSSVSPLTSIDLDSIGTSFREGDRITVWGVKR